jgi:hypothetical protein
MPAPTPRPTPTFARIAPVEFPLTDLPRKANFDGSSLLIDIEDSAQGTIGPDNHTWRPSRSTAAEAAAHLMWGFTAYATINRN